MSILVQPAHPLPFETAGGIGLIHVFPAIGRGVPVRPRARFFPTSRAAR